MYESYHRGRNLCMAGGESMGTVWPWLTKNWLALYGAVIATIALAPNFLGYVHKVRAGKIRLKLSCVADPKPPHHPDRFIVTVTNTGVVPAPLGEAGVVDENGRKHVAIEPVQAGSMARLLPAFHITLDPHASKQASVPIKANESRFRAAMVYAVRQDGKEIHKRVGTIRP